MVYQLVGHARRGQQSGARPDRPDLVAEDYLYRAGRYLDGNIHRMRVHPPFIAG